MSKLLKTTIMYLSAMYIMNRIAYISMITIGSLTYYPISIGVIDFFNETQYRFSINLAYFLPLNPYFLLSIIPNIFMNSLSWVLYQKYFSNNSLFIRIRSYLSLILITYLIAILLFALLSYYNGYIDHVSCDGCWLEIFLIGMVPYHPMMIGGYLFGGSIFAVVWIFIFERYVFKKWQE